jgi:heat shock protein HtpX
MASCSLFFFSGSRDGNNGPNLSGSLVAIFAAPIAATTIQLGISRTHEFAANEGAAHLTGNPGALACALQRLESSAARHPLSANPVFAPLLIINPLPHNWMRSLFLTHPATEPDSALVGASQPRFLRR